MALVKKNQISGQVAVKADEDAAASGSKLLAEAQKRKARTFARQQKAAERTSCPKLRKRCGMSPDRWRRMAPVWVMPANS
jgi:methyl-accepting chemotaxis protein